MWVVKVGGSLQFSRSLVDWLKLLAREGGGNVAVVPGGGEFADRVRATQAGLGFDDATAHRLALQAMEEFAGVLAHLEPRLVPAASEREIRQTVSCGLVPVWLPSQMAGSAPEIPQDWSVTSDSLALWLARRLQADAVILLKSVEPPRNSRDAAQLAAAGYVDEAFPRFFADYSGRVTVVAQDDKQSMAAWLRSGALPEEKRLVIRDEALV